MLDTLFIQKHRDLTPSQLLAVAVARGEGVLATNGALNVLTGKRTGRSPKDRYIVCDASTESTVDWGVVNQKMTPACFQALWNKAVNYLKSRPVYVNQLRVGADDRHALGVTVYAELAWHALFAQHLFIADQTPPTDPAKQWTVLSAPKLLLEGEVDGVASDAAVVLNFTERQVLIIGTEYAGEMKKAMFSVLNYGLPDARVLPMHCAANVGESGDVTLFFGLSGTGKTTLSADEDRYLIGDDEHGWSAQGVFNFEGGCYAKCIDLSEAREPVIWHAIREGAVMENVVLNEDNVPDFADAKYTQNTRAVYPRAFIDKKMDANRGSSPNAVVFLTCDLYGVLPPVARLSRLQAAYYFLSGYTALVGSTEMGSQPGIKTTFSVCFGAPFFPRPAQVYADLLLERLDQTGADVYLVNTGWTGGGYGQGGERFSIPTTRAVIHAIQKGFCKEAHYDVLPGFGLAIPKALPGVETRLLDPRQTWVSQEAYEEAANGLIRQFEENMRRFPKVSVDIKTVGPHLITETVGNVEGV